MDIPQLWNEWDVRVLILVSLANQIILIFLGRLRKTFFARWIRWAVWCNYLLANWVAHFVLGKLSSSMDFSSIPSSSASSISRESTAQTSSRRICSSSGGSDDSNALLAFWAPFLLLHLGGPDTITAYAIEDNELWARSLLDLGSNLITAVYVLFLSLSRNRLLAPTLLIFLSAIIKYAERICSLYRASIGGFRSSVNQLPSEDEVSSLLKLPTSGVAVENRRKKLGTDAATAESDISKGAFALYSICKLFFIDVLPSPQWLARLDVDFLKKRTPRETMKLINAELSFAYDEIYTKAAVIHSIPGCTLRSMSTACTLTASMLFIFATKEGFNRINVIITYALLLASVFLDLSSNFMLVFSEWTVVSLLMYKTGDWWRQRLAELIARARAGWRRWCRTALIPTKTTTSSAAAASSSVWSREIPQMNFISSCVENARRTATEQRRPFSIQRSIGDWATKLGNKLEVVEGMLVLDNRSPNPKEYLFSPQRPQRVTPELEDMIATYLQTLTEPAEDALELPSGRGWSATVKLMSKMTDAMTAEVCIGMLESIEFDMAVFFWHIVTELCYRFSMPKQQEEEQRKLARNCKQLSDYMLYLTLMRPEMMSTMVGMSEKVIQLMSMDVVDFICSNPEIDLGAEAVEDVVCRELLMSSPLQQDKRSYTSARFLALSLLVCLGEKERWESITAMWMDLLIQGARRSRGGMNAKQLSKGGEFFTCIWLLIKHNVYIDLLHSGKVPSDVEERADQLASVLQSHSKDSGRTSHV